MTNRPRRVGACGVLAACLLAGLTACTTARQPAPSGPQATGSLIVESDEGEIAEITFGANSSASDKQIVAAGQPGPIGSTLPVPAAALSPDGTTLAYGVSRDLTLLDLHTGTDRTLALPDSTTVQCVNWATDGRHLAVGTSDALYLSDPAGHMTSLYTRSSEQYRSISGSGELSTLTSSFACGSWLNPTDLVFQQSGPFPGTIGKYTLSSLPADTTTVVTLRAGAAPSIDNEPTLWSIVAACDTLTVTTSGSGLYLVSGLNGRVTADQAAPASAKIGDAQTSTALLPDGTCRPILIRPAHGTGYEAVQIDPQTHHTVASWQIPDGCGLSQPEQTDFQWGPQPRGTVLAYLAAGQLCVTNLASGVVMEPNDPLWSGVKVILGWTDPGS